MPGWLSDAGSGASIGTAIDPGVGTVIGAGVGALSGVIGGIINNNSQKSINKQNIAAAQAAAAQQEQYAIQNFNMNNAYNSPTAQMARLKSAGLNPNLVYGNGATATSGGAPTTPAPAQTFHSQSGNPGNSVAALGVLGNAPQAYLSMMQSAAQIKQTNAQTLNVNADTASKLLGNTFNTDTLFDRENQVGASYTGTSLDNFMKQQQNQQFLKTAPLSYSLLKNQASASDYLSAQAQAQLGLTQSQTKGQDLTNQIKQPEASLSNTLGAVGAAATGIGPLLLRALELAL